MLSHGESTKGGNMPLSEAQATVIGSGMGLIGNLFGGLGAKRRQRYAKEMMDYQNKLELERMEQQFGYQQQAAAQEQKYALDMYNHQFNTESAYNREMLENQRKYDSPVQEMARLKEAGVNPALYYANGGGSGGSGIGAMGVSASGSSASVGAPTGIQPMAVQVGLQAQQQEATIELTKAEAAKTRAETVSETGIGMAQRVLDALGKAKENKKTDVDIKKVEKEVENIDAAIQVAKENANVLKENKELLAYQNRMAYLLPDVFCPASDLDHEAHIFCPDQTGSGLLSYCRHHSPDAARHLAGSWLRTRQKRASFFSVNASLLQSHHKVPPRCQ